MKHGALMRTLIMLWLCFSQALRWRPKSEGWLAQKFNSRLKRSISCQSTKRFSSKNVDRWIGLL